MNDLDLRRRADALFCEILDLPPDEWPAALDRACPEPGALRSLVQRLLAGAAEDSGLESELVSAVRGGLAERFGADESGFAAGTVVGPFRIEEELGRGGMGVVYRARRSEDFEQVVALKLLMVAADRRLRRRFETERTMLARLEHPNIARMIDGGVTADGTPYFAMEYVEGRPLDGYLAQGLGLRARIELFLQIARAVEFAHRQLLVHCDIKPANILVDGDGRARLLDFGIGRMLEEQDGSATQTRGFLTPQYASPEQLLGRPVTPATDIYQLGLLLYEMLAGVRPYSVGGKTPAEVQRAICVDEPSRPSRATAPAGPATPPPTVRRRLRGELDTIVMTALRKDSGRRYPSVSALIADLDAFLANRPIAARPATPIYRMRKFVRRNPGSTVAALAIFSLLTAYGVTVGVQRERIARERDAAKRESQRAEQALGIMFDVFTSNNPHEGHPAEVTARRLLDRAAERIEGDESLAVELRADLTAALAQTYNGLWLPGKAQEVAWRSVDLHRAAYGPDDPRLVRILLLAGRNATRGGDFERGETALRELLDVAERVDLDPELISDAYFVLAQGLSRQRKYEEAESMIKRWFETVPEDDEDLVSGTGHTVYAQILADASRFVEALPYYEEAARRKGRSLGEESLAAVNARAGVAFCRIHLGDIERGLEEARAALRGIHDKLGTRTVDYGATQQRLAAALLRAGEPTVAEEMARRSLESLQGHDANPSLFGFNHFVLAEVALGRGDLEMARREVEQAGENVPSDGGTVTARILELVARIEIADGDPAAAREALSKALDIYEAVPSQAHRKAAVEAQLSSID